MWRRLGRCDALKQGISAAVGRRPLPSPQSPQMMEGAVVRTSPAFHGKKIWVHSSSSDAIANAISNSKSAGGLENLTLAEAKKLMRLVNVESLKTKLEMEGKEVIGYTELLEACQSMDVARSLNEAIAFERVLDEAGVVLIFRDKVYLHPRKVPFLSCISLYSCSSAPSFIHT